MDASLETLKALDELAAAPGETRRCINCGGYEDSSIDPTGCTCEGDFRAPWAKRGGDDVLVGTANTAEEYTSFQVQQYVTWLAKLEDKLVTYRRLLAEARADRHAPYSSIDRFETTIKTTERDIATAQKALGGAHALDADPRPNGHGDRGAGLAPPFRADHRAHEAADR